MINLTDELHDFYETAKLISNLDAVVSVDTSVAHLAGALGKPTLLMTPRDNCWRWFGSRIDSPWYNSMMQFRQPAPGDWPSVIAGVCEQLKFNAEQRKQYPEVWYTMHFSKAKADGR